MPTVSVVIPSYNRKSLVVEAVASVFAQSFTGHEVIVVDDGSSDGTDVALQSFAGRVRYFHKAHGGVASARNLGIREAAGSLIAFLDSDDLWESNFLEVTVGFLEENHDIALVCTGWRTLGSEHRWPPIKAPLLRGDLFPELMRERIMRTSAVVARRKFLLDDGMFDERLDMAEDLDLWLRIAARHPTALINLPLSWARRHDDRLSKDRCRHLERQIEVLRSHFDPRRIEKSEFDRRLSSLHTELGEAHLKRGDFTAARGCFQSSLALTPFSFRARRYLVKAWWAGRG